MREPWHVLRLHLLNRLIRYPVVLNVVNRRDFRLRSPHLTRSGLVELKD